jgi:hypothetical protein
MKTLNRQGGFATLAMVIAIIVFFFIVLLSLQRQTILFAKRHVEVKTYTDAINAIEVFAQPLYRTYVLGSQIAPNNATLGKRYRESDLVTYTNSSGTELKLFAPSNQKICSYRSLPNGKVEPLCVKLPNDLLVSRIADDNTIEVARAQDLKDVWKDRLMNGAETAVALLRHTVEAIRLPEAQAQTPSSVSDPGNGALSDLSFNVARNFDTAFSTHYSNHHCLNTAEFDCVKIRLCMKLGQACSVPEDYIIQTYIFDKPPKSQLKN